MGVRRRFIPACAGNACPWQRNAGYCPVHPRMRGERLPVKSRTKPSTGSSPHARGTHGADHDAGVPVRFIPACAGNAIIRSRFTTAPAVHPRMRGERWSDNCASDQSRGSSPHARGTRGLQAAKVRIARFIPACAGNANPRPIIWRHKTVHPRMRGERESHDFFRYHSSGSSPHARGTRRRSRPDGAVCRFIPACAGNATPGT